MNEDIVPVGPPLKCPYYRAGEDTDGSLRQISDSENLPWCVRFQLNPTCGNNLEECDVGWNRPDPREGYR
jgi:hypothetical protein